MKVNALIMRRFNSRVPLGSKKIGTIYQCPGRQALTPL